MKNNKMKCKLPETKRQSSRISMEPDRYGQNTLTVKVLLFPKHISSTMSVITIDDTLRGNKESMPSPQKGFQTNRLKRKGKIKNIENNNVTITKKIKVNNGEKNLIEIMLMRVLIRIICSRIKH